MVSLKLLIHDSSPSVCKSVSCSNSLFIFISVLGTLKVKLNFKFPRVRLFISILLVSVAVFKNEFILWYAGTTAVTKKLSKRDLLIGEVSVGDLDVRFVGVSCVFMIAPLGCEKCLYS